MPLGELPFQALTSRASCLQSTGAPGELARVGSAGLEFLQAGPGGVVPTGYVVTGGQPIACPVAVVRPGGAGALIVPAARLTGADDDEGQVWVAARDPGGIWTQASLVASSATAYPINVAAAASARGDAIAAWIELREKNEAYSFHIRAVRRGPGERFGAPVEIVAGPVRDLDVSRGVRAAIAAEGETVVVWGLAGPYRRRSRRPVGRSGRRSGWGSLPRLTFDLDSPSAAFAALASPPPALAMAPDGRALVLFASRTGPQVVERAPGAGFGAAAAVGDAATAADQIAADLGADGRAIVAWRVAGGGAVLSAARERPGPFGL